ncbi:hypothetical protein Fcan01_10664 [Folsomia candida]|uniref:Uncharacterized protein n=1 Tax=Folsomia candida TaxID=158441 RepID=A0A226ECW6_FOLCA|nr:hypothetical protein Fcan01_10664 [Folsomia candida]
MDLLMSLVLPMVIFTCFTIPIFTTGLLLAFPCQPPFIGSMLPCCTNGERGIQNKWVKFSMAIFEGYMFYQVTVSGSFFITQVMVGCCLSLWNYIKILKQWTRDPSYKKGYLLQAYKYLRVLEMLNNNCVRSRMFPAGTIGFPAAQFFCGYVCIKFHSSMSVWAVGVFFLLYCDGVMLTTTMFTTAAHVYINSRELLITWKSGWGTRKNSELRKTMRGFPPMKVRCGSNFVDNSTPLVIQDMCTRQTVSTLLISNK